MKFLLDVNALIALGFRQYFFHRQVAAWMAGIGPLPGTEIITCSSTELGFVRILVSGPQFVINLAQARSLLARLRKSAAVRFTFLINDHGAA